MTTVESKYEGDCMEKLHAVGLINVYWHGKCEAEKVTTGTYHVRVQGGMFALVGSGTPSSAQKMLIMYTVTIGV